MAMKYLRGDPPISWESRKKYCTEIGAEAAGSTMDGTENVQSTPHARNEAR